MKKHKLIFSEIDPFLTFILLKSLNILGWGRISQVLRGKILRAFGFNLGKKVSISYGVMIYQRRDHLKIGEGTFINQNVYFDAGSPITIGKHCDIGYNAVFAGSKHQLKSTPGSNRPVIKSAPITIEDNVWIGCNAVIISGVTVGKGSVIGAGSIVTKNIPPNVFAAGNPARVIKEI